MNKAELIDAMAKETGMTKADAKKALEAFVASTMKALKKNDRVALVGFGSFSVSKRAARKGRNPQTRKGNQDCSQEGCQIQTRRRSFAIQ